MTASTYGHLVDSNTTARIRAATIDEALASVAAGPQGHIMVDDRKCYVEFGAPEHSIGVGDWVSGGDDVGVVHGVHGALITVGWEAGGTTTDLARGLDAFGSREDALDHLSVEVE
jgi:hypothetical protein